MTDTGLTNLRWAYALVDGLAAAGLRQAVISPGSRSTPLVLACERHPLIETRVHLDERGAAFIALGQARRDTRPTAVIATSGSAPTHWYPAVVEAALSGLPLLLLSADRPPELHGWGANQTLDQQRLFGVHVRAFHPAGVPEDNPPALRQIRLLGSKAVEQSLWPAPGPVHINLPFREPLIPETPPTEWPREAGTPFPLALAPPAPDPAQMDRLAGRMQGRPGIILCGPTVRSSGWGAAVTKLAAKLNCPVLADPLSGLRFGPWPKDLLLTRYDTFLRKQPMQPEPDWVLQLGATPVSKTLNRQLARIRPERLLLAPDGVWPDPEHLAVEIVRADPATACLALADRLQTGGMEPLTRRLLAAEHNTPEGVPRESDQPFEGHVIPELLAALPDASRLLCGNSMPVRQLDTWSGSGQKPLHIHCNRGASGIDGGIATLAGLAGDGRPTVGLLGDLALAHDLNSLGALKKRHVVLIVLNNGGGGIFGQLPQANLEQFHRYWLTPQDLNLALVARSFGLNHHLIDRQSRFAPALELALNRPATHLIEVRIDREYSLRRHQAYWNEM